MNRCRPGLLLLLLLLVHLGHLGACAAPALPELRVERDVLRARMGPRATPAQHRDYGWSLLALGETGPAVEELRRARALGLHDARTLLGLGLRAHDTGQTEAARDLWTTILETYDPHDGWAPAVAELAAHRLLALGADAPGSGDAERAYVERLSRLAGRSAALPAEARQLLLAFAGQVLRMAGREDDARALDERRGCPATFAAAGPYGHLPRLDLSASFPPDDPAYDPGNQGYRRQTSRGCEMTLDGAQGRPGVMYAIVWAELPETGPVPLVLESGGEPWTLYVDGQVRYREAEPVRRRLLWLDLPAGRHALALKVAVPGGRVQVQLAIPGARFHDGPLAVLRRAPRGSDREGNPVLEVRRPSPLPPARAARDQVLRGLLLGQQAYITGETDAGVAAVEAALQRAPRFAPLWLLRASLDSDDTSRPQRVIRERVRKAEGRALQLDPTLLRARLNLANIELQEERAEQALELLDAAPRDPGGPEKPSWQALLLRYRILKARSWLNEAEQALLRALGAGPAACAPLEALIDQRREMKDEAGAAQAARKLVACNPYSDRYADELRAAGSLEAAEKEYGRLLQLDPDSETWQQALADVLVSEDQPAALKRAQELLVKLVARYGRTSSYRVKLANVLLRQSGRKAAEAALRAGMEQTPESLDLHRALLALGIPSVMDPYRVDGREVIREYARAHAGESLPDAAVIVLDRTVTRVFATGARLTLTHNIIHVLAKDGLDKFGEVQVPEGADVLTLRTVKADGSTREPEEIAEKASVSAPDLEIGDYVEFEYVDRTAAPAAFPDGFLAERFYFASPDAPLGRTEYVLVTPWEMPLQLDLRGPEKGDPASGGRPGERDLPQAAVSRRGEDRVTVWSRRDVARITPEPPEAEGLAGEWLPSVRAAGGVSFSRWRDYLRDRLFSTLRPNDELRRLAAQVAGPAPAPGDSAAAEAASLRRRTRLLCAWVRRNVKHAGGIDEDATVVLARREGNRVVLLAGLLRSAGIPFELWLARPVTAPRLDGALPDAEAYSEPVLAIGPGLEQGRRPLLWIEPQYRHAPAGLLRPSLRGARALRVAPGGGQAGAAEFATIDLQSDGAAAREAKGQGGAPPVDLRRMELTMNLSADGSGEVLAKETLSGWPALEWREELERADDEQIRKELEQRSLGFFFPGASLLDLHYGPIDEDEAPLVVEYRFRAPHLARRLAPGEGGEAPGKGGRPRELVLPVPYPSLLSRRYVGVPHRRTPLILNYVVPTRLAAQVVLPRGAKVAQLGPSLSSSDFGHFVQRVELSGERLVLRAEFAMPIQRVGPEQYTAFVQHAAQVDAAEDRMAVITVGR